MDHLADPQQSFLCAQAGDLAQLIGPDGKRFTLRLYPGERLQTHKGILEFDHMIGLPWGSEVHSHIGNAFYLLKPSLDSILLETPRRSTIMYPKEIGFILVNMSIGPGSRVLEAGSGSGGLTTALAFSVGDNGHVYSYEMRKDMQRVAMRNIDALGFSERVTFRRADIAEGMQERGIDAVFLDLPNPEDYLPQVRASLVNGGFFGSLLPTTNQVSLLLKALEANNFGFVEVCEILLRYYKPIANRLRPTDRMVAHTGFLIFARALLGPPFSQDTKNLER